MGDPDSMELKDNMHIFFWLKRMQNDSYDTSHILVPHECPIFQSHLYTVELCDKVRHTLLCTKLEVTQEISDIASPPRQDKWETGQEERTKEP